MPDDELDIEGLTEPRCHFYALAHIVLRQLALMHPRQFVELMSSPRSMTALAAAWQLVCDHCRDRAPAPVFAPDDLQARSVSFGGNPGVVIELPSPERITEAWFVALVLIESDPAGARYFTLEYGMPCDGAPRSVLCEWTQSAHRNYGNGPPPTVEEFVVAVTEALGG